LPPGTVEEQAPNVPAQDGGFALDRWLIDKLFGRR